MTEDPILDALARAFRELQPPPAQRELHDSPAATRASVAWLADAWQRLEPPPAAVPAAAVTGVRVRPRVSRLPMWRRHAAAAVVLAALALSLRLRTQGPGPSAPPPPTADATQVAVVDGHLELRHGAVRLLLLSPAADAPR